MRFFSIKPFLILLFFVFAIPVAYSQDTLNFSIKWLPPVKSWFKADSSSGKVLLNFQNAKHNTSGIPVFTDLKLVGNNCSQAEARIISYSIDTILNSESFSHYSSIPENLDITTSLLIQEKKKFVRLSFIPLIKKNNKILRIKNISIEVKYQHQSEIKKSSNVRWENSSIMSSGAWKKIAITKTGIYKIFYNEIKNMGFSNPAEIRIYGNGGDMLPEKYSGTEPSDLKEIPITFINGTDGIFNEGDFIIFYATGPITWNYDYITKKFSHSKHLYSNEIYYFLTAAPNGYTVNNASPVSLAEDLSVTTFLDYDVHEEEKFNPIKSGRHWIGENFSSQTSRTFNFSFTDALANSQFTIEGEVIARSQTSTAFSVSHNSSVVINQGMNSVNTGDETSNYADSKTFKANSVISGNQANIAINFDKKGNNGAEGWLNFLRLNVTRKLKYNNTPLFFRDTSLLKLNKVVKYTIENTGSSVLVWDVTDINSVFNISYTTQNNNLSFLSTTDTLRQFAVFNPADASTPIFLSDTINTIENQNLHALANIQMVIIAHKQFLNEAEELAEIHRTTDNLTVVTVTPDKIYNEFSSGVPDPAAYRNFMKMLYDKATTEEERPKYLLLFGDGSYKNRSDNENNTNFILTYQSVNSLRAVSSYVSDDYFGLLDDNESIETGLLDLGIGRFPVSTPGQAKAVIKKIKNYISSASSGSWRNNICFIADDEDGNIHMSQADQLSNYVDANYPSFNSIKLYADAYPQLTTSAGPRFPEMNKAIENTLNRGVLVVNYTGHGGEEGLAHEQIVKHEDVTNWGNSIYPLFVTATCEFSRFDDYEITTAGEDVLLNENGGGIGLLTTTRLVYSGPNFVLNQQFYNNFAKRDASGAYLRLGDILKLTKNSSGSDINKLCFTLLGDPALRLAYPHYQVQTTKINSQDINVFTDTLKAYSEVTVNGIITDQNGTQLTDFNGTVYPSLFDKAQTVKTLSNDNGAPFVFQQKESILYKGKATVKNGQFEFSFVVPREIAYNYGNGRFSYYASNGSIDAAGSFDDFLIGGIASGEINDNEGPVINLFLNDKNFVSGGTSNQFPTLLADLTDENGINIAGTSIGHDIVGILDGNSANSFVLNNYFESAIDDYKSGTVTFKLPKINPGKHTISIKAWDILNNSSVAEIAFEVVDSSKFFITNVYNFPNPFTESTTFVFDHNQPGKTLDTELQIFTPAGKLVTREKLTIQSDGFTSGPIEWSNGINNYKKLPGGIYVYRFVFRYKGVDFASESKKMVVSE